MPELRSFIICLFLFSFSCTLEEQNNLLIAPSCTDGIRNQDEEGIDCGGICVECKTRVTVKVTVPCKNSLMDNSLDFEYFTMKLTDDDYSLDQESDLWEILIWKDNREIRITFSGDIPEKDKTFAIAQFPLEQDEATLKLIDGFTDFVSTGGSVYVVYENSNPTIQFCDIIMVDANFDFTAMGKIIL